ncbi:MAG: endolytic transglycosylase MltG [candidate division WOR-3 bacterium]
MRFVRLVQLAAFLLACRTTTPQPGRRVEVRIRAGMSAAELADTLLAHGVIRNRFRFMTLARFHSCEPRIVSGRYHLRLGTDEARVLQLLSREVPALVMVTVPEGLTCRQVAELLSECGICPAEQFLAACFDTVLLRELGVPATSAEGFLFPETYELSTTEPPANIIRRMVQQFFAVLKDSSGPDLLATVTLASIVEKEARLPEEFPRIAGVFVNRLKRHLPLQSCATVQYVLPERKSVLAVEDTRYPSPYNTYLHLGLPPGPICNPGRRALAAARNPEQHDYVFFVARGDGSHIFSRTAAEHDAACARVRRSRS